MAKVKVQVVERGGEFFVVPPTVVAEKSDNLVVNNTTTVGLAFVMQGVPNGPYGSVNKIEEIAAKSKKSMPIGGGAVDGEYMFQIVMLNGKKAVGNSDPVLIIDN